MDVTDGNVIQALRAAARELLRAARDVPFVYHVTRLGRLSSIAQKGLLPGQRGNFGGFKNHVQGKVFFVSGAGVEWWFNRLNKKISVRGPDDLCVVLRVRADKLQEADRDYLGSNHSRGLAYMVERGVPAGRLDIWDGAAWVPLVRHDHAAMVQKAMATAKPFSHREPGSPDPSHYYYDEYIFEPMLLRNAEPPAWARDDRYDQFEEEAAQAGKKRRFRDLAASALRVEEQGKSPLEYHRSGNVQRIALIDDAAGPADKNDSYFSEIKTYQRYGKTGRALKKPIEKVTPGAPQNVVAFLDYHDEGEGIYIDYMKTRSDFRGRGHAKVLVEFLYNKFKNKDYIHWGKVLSPGAWSILEKYKNKPGYPHTMGHVDF